MVGIIATSLSMAAGGTGGIIGRSSDNGTPKDNTHMMLYLKAY